MEAEDRYTIGPLQLQVSQGLENLFLEFAGMAQWLASYFTNLFSWPKQMIHKLSFVNCWHSDGATDFVSFFSSCRIYSLGFSVLDRITIAYETRSPPHQGLLPALGVSNLPTKLLKCSKRLILHVVVGGEIICMIIWLSCVCLHRG